MPETAEKPTRQRVGTPHPAADPREPQDSPRRVSRTDDDAEPREGDELLEAAARIGSNDKSRETLSEDEQADALEWFLSPESEDVTDDIELNVGTARKPKWIKWTIQTVDRDELRRIRRQSREQGNRRERRRAAAIGQGTELDADAANLRIVVEGTVYPDLRAAAKQMNLVDPADAVRRRFRKKPGLIDQIAGEVMSLSGYDDEDVREVQAARG